MKTRIFPGRSPHGRWPATGLALVAVPILLIAFSTPVAAQIPGMPVWNTPSGLSGLMVAGDIGAPSKSNPAYAGRALVGLGPLSLGGAVDIREPGSNALKSYGFTGALRLAGGPLMPVSLNAQGGWAASTRDRATDHRYTAAVGASIRVPVPGFGLEPWISPGVRIEDGGGAATPSTGTDTRFGVAWGVNLTLGVWGIHAAVDHEKDRLTTYGAGVHLKFGAPL